MHPSPKSLMLESKSPRYMVGVMQALVEATDEVAFESMVQESLAIVRDTLTEELGIDIRFFNFSGPHLSPEAGSYAAMDFFRVGSNEKIERNMDFTR